jgi:hypothetical protein
MPLFGTVRKDDVTELQTPATRFPGRLELEPEAE